jgi:hypothetical protein
MSISDEAEKLRNYANAYIENSINATTGCGNNINDGIGKLQAVKQAGVHSVVVATTYLGVGHPAITNVANSAGFLITTAEELEEMLEGVINKMTELDQYIGNHGTLLTDIANRLLQGGDS